ncbi:MAG: hypothetical protein QOJ30_5248 [Pseudonocardiales bacterium]|nr:hypothetical protein [Pseudonocardiales bacterium]
MPARPIARSLLTAGALAGATVLGRAARGLPTALGAGSTALLAAAARSPHARDGVFTNTEPGSVLAEASPWTILGLLLTRGRSGRPSDPVPLAPALPHDADAAELAVTWFGHSSVLLEIDGCRVLADPVWGERVSPSPVFGPKRLHPAPAPLERLPPVDVLLISHDHYDHLDLPTVTAIAADPKHSAARFVVPLGIGAHLRSWGVPDERITELDWGGATRVAGLTLTCAEARHFSGRSLRRNTTQWSSWAIAGPRHRVYFGGDTGYTAAFARAGERLGPFDLTVLPIGAYAEVWPDVHMNPEESVAAHRDLRGGVLLPVHWATFNLGFHAWAEPVDRLRLAAGKAGIPLALPLPGQRIDLADPPEVHDWWSPVA